jgi:hypothetical protein
LFPHVVAILRNPASASDRGGRSKKHARAVDDGKVKSAGKTDKASRAADEANEVISNSMEAGRHFFRSARFFSVWSILIGRVWSPDVPG